MTFVLLTPWVAIFYPIFPVAKYRTETLWFTDVMTTTATKTEWIIEPNGARSPWTEIIVDEIPLAEGPPRIIAKTEVFYPDSGHVSIVFTMTWTRSSYSISYRTLTSTEIQNFFTRNRFEIPMLLSVLFFGSPAIMYVYVRLRLPGGSKRYR